jgi:hypothetical protein
VHILKFQWPISPKLLNTFFPNLNHWWSMTGSIYVCWIGAIYCADFQWRPLLWFFFKNYFLENYARWRYEILAADADLYWASSVAIARASSADFLIYRPAKKIWTPIGRPYWPEFCQYFFTTIVFYYRLHITTWRKIGGIKIECAVFAV